MTKKIRVLVVEDSITVRKKLVEILKSDPEFEVAGEITDGCDVMEACLRLRPDVITMDMMLPTMTGLEATIQIMAYHPTPILIVSSSTNRGELFKTYQALTAGAVDVMEKPLGPGVELDWIKSFLSRVRLVSRIKVITHIQGKRDNRHFPHKMERKVPWGGREPIHYSCVGLGLSTGGPSALVQILKEIPSNFSLPILVVIHMGNSFGLCFAEWLNSLSPLPVESAKDMTPLPYPKKGKGRVFLAPPDFHMFLEKGHIRLDQSPERHSCRPSVDILFESMAREIGPKSIAGLLTGMGKDGAQGLLAIRKREGLTLAQDEATSTVFGMPREAILLGAAQKVLPLQEFAPTLLELEGGNEK